MAVPSGRASSGPCLPVRGVRAIGARTRGGCKGMQTVCATQEASVSTPTLESEARRPTFSLSYAQQYDQVFQGEINPRQALPKPSKNAQAAEPSGIRVWLSDVVATGKRTLFGREWEVQDVIYFIYMITLHGMCVFAPMTFSWPMVGLFLATYYATGCLGITLSFHRQLSHRSFTTPKWLEYLCAYCGVLAGQGGPIEWISNHRYHHLHTDTALDLHSPYEGFWWSHWGWIFDKKIASDRVGERANIADLSSQPFYRWLEKTYPFHLVGMFGVLYLFGGFPAVVWGGCFRLVFLYHVTWFVNSAAHVWGKQSYATNDLSRNNWWVAALAFGEGWHNNHHAFEFSARHGLDPKQFDFTWQVIRLLNALGLAKNIKLPTEAQKEKLAIKQ